MLTLYCMRKPIFWLFVGLVFSGCHSNGRKTDPSKSNFPEQLVSFVSYPNNSVFSAADTNAWDRHIRERGWIIREDSTYNMWYTGYASEEGERHLGFAQSTDGIHWTRYPSNPIYSAGWVEDVCVVKSNGTYYMFSEGRGDTAHLLTSTDKINWKEKGNLDIRQTNGQPIKPGPFGTPTIWIEDSIWYLFYERNDLGIWLAKSTDQIKWTNVQDSPVIALGPETYDRYAVAMNQVIKYNGLYYGYYHASAFADWREWSTNVASSEDLIHWTKYPGNPLLKQNKSSGIMINDGKRYRLYTMHDRVQVHFPVTDSLP